MNTMRRIFQLGIVGCLLLVTSCGEDDAATIPAVLNLTNTTLGLTESAEVGVTFSRAAAADGSITVSITSNLTHGETADFYTDPGASNGVIILDYLQGAESASITVFAGTGLNIAQDETIALTVTEAEGFELGNDLSAIITVSENFVAANGTLEINGGGSEFPNQAFIDLSKLTQTTVDKYTWDLGFSSESGTFSVVLNSSALVMARPIDAANLDEVTAADTVGFASKMYLSNYVDTEASEWIDDQSGDFGSTAIAEISATDGENSVYIIKRDGEGRNWKKVRIIRSGTGYEIQYADVNATTHSTATISKDESYNFSHFDLDNGVVSVEPEKDNWDIMYSTYSGRANFGVWLGISYNDYIIVNRSGVSVAMVEEGTISYDNFSTTDMAGIALVDDNIAAIGSSWRGLVDFALVLNEDVYYVLKDADGHNYKLKFTRLTSEFQERGYPEFKFDLIQ